MVGAEEVLCPAGVSGFVRSEARELAADQLVIRFPLALLGAAKRVVPLLRELRVSRPQLVDPGPGNVSPLAGDDDPAALMFQRQQER